MGFLLIFFPEEDTTTAIINRNKFSPPSATSLIKRTTSDQLLSKALSTIFICFLLVLITLFLFTLSTFEPSSSAAHFPPRRQLSQFSAKSHFKYSKISQGSLALPHALQGMGTLYRRGTKAMSDLIVAHVVETLNVHELKLFLGVLHKSALISRSDLVLLFSSKSNNSIFDAAILEQSGSFLKLVEYYQEIIFKRPVLLNSTASFDAIRFAKWSKTGKESREPIWGRRSRSNSSEGNTSESTGLSYGSVVGFSVDELDLENSLSGFVDHVPMNLRRWACYPMLLGRVKRNYKHIMLVDAKEILLPGDPLSRVRNMSPESVFLYPTSTQSAITRHAKKNSEKTQSAHGTCVSPAIIIGGGRGIRRLANAMLNDIVRMSMQTHKKKKNSVTELGVFNQLACNEFWLKNVKLIKRTESIPQMSSLTELNSKPGSESSMSNFTVLRRGNSNFSVNSTIMKNILCVSLMDSLFYSDCN